MHPIAAGCRNSAVALSALLLSLGPSGCREVPSSPTIEAVAAKGGRPTGDLVVKAVVPDEAPRNITLDLSVTGSGFDQSALVSFEKGGSPVPGVKTNKTTFLSSSALVANVTIDVAASPDQYDVVVTLTGGKRGIGVEQFEVLDVIWLGPLEGERLFQATSINSAGKVAGWGATTPFFWSEPGGAEWVWAERTWWAYPTGINDHDQVVGYTCGWAFTPQQSCGYADSYGVIWARGTSGGWTTTVITSRGDLPSDITNDGTVFVSRYLASGGWTPYVKRPGQALVPMPIPPGAASATRVAGNNTGQATGGSLFWWFSQDGTGQAITLGSPSGGADPAAVSLSDLAGNTVYVVGSALFGGVRQPVRWVLTWSGTAWGIRSERLGVSFKTKPYGAGYARGVNTAGFRRSERSERG